MGKELQSVTNSLTNNLLLFKYIVFDVSSSSPSSYFNDKMAAKILEATDATFEEMVLANKHKLPLTVQATEGVYANSDRDEISNGDILRLLDVTDKVAAEFVHPVTGEKVQVDVPSSYEGGFQTVLRCVVTHAYHSVGEIVRDFPPAVRVLEDNEVKGRMVKRGEGLKLIRIENTEGEKSLHCTHFPQEVPILLPFSTKGRFSPKGDDTIYTVRELVGRMPVLVRRERNIGFEIRNAFNIIPGVPDNFYDTMLLTKKTMVKVEHWDNPGSVGIHDVTTMTETYLPIDLPIAVIPAEGIDTQYGPQQDLFELAAQETLLTKPVFAMCTDGQKCLYCLDLPQGAILVIHGTEIKKGLVCNGTSSNLLVPRDYKKTTLFKVCTQMRSPQSC